MINKNLFINKNNMFSFPLAFHKFSWIEYLSTYSDIYNFFFIHDKFNFLIIQIEQNNEYISFLIGNQEILNIEIGKAQVHKKHTWE